LVLTATDLDVGVQYHLPLLNQPERGAVTIPARRLTTIVRELPEEPITLEAKTNHTTILECGTSRFRIPGLPAEDFPTFPPLEHAEAITIPQPTLRGLITRTAFAMSMEETRFILNGTLVRLQPQALTLVATDGRRLAVASAPAPTAVGGAGGHPKDASLVVPAKTIRELGRLLQDEEEEPVTVAPLKDNQLLFRFGSVTVITRLIEGQFPQYDSVIPAPSKTTVTCSRQLLMSAVRRVSLMTTAASQAVVFELAKGQLVISKESPEFGSAREELTAMYAGEPMTVAFNPEFWLDALKVLEDETVTIELASPDKPAVIRQPHFLYIVLPMKLA
ncbi:MAG: DNA polymerase III subunit beta, partial [Candidatus Omnitrophica bacterium]|nr:DNA polymerase III subunit beta [Candidatus Omnitrophota bacterium]